MPPPPTFRLIMQMCWLTFWLGQNRIYMYRIWRHMSISSPADETETDRVWCDIYSQFSLLLVNVYHCTFSLPLPSPSYGHAVADCDCCGIGNISFIFTWYIPWIHPSSWICSVFRLGVWVWCSRLSCSCLPCLFEQAEERKKERKKTTDLIKPIHSFS